MINLGECAVCKATQSTRGGPLLYCTVCLSTVYCSAEHQSLDSRAHRGRCRVLSEARRNDRLSPEDLVGSWSSSGHFSVRSAAERANRPDLTMDHPSSSSTGIPIRGSVPSTSSSVTSNHHLPPPHPPHNHHHPDFNAPPPISIRQMVEQQASLQNSLNSFDQLMASLGTMAPQPPTGLPAPQALKIENNAQSGHPSLFPLLQQQQQQQQQQQRPQMFPNGIQGLDPNNILALLRELQAPQTPTQAATPVGQIGQVGQAPAPPLLGTSLPLVLQQALLQQQLQQQQIQHQQQQQQLAELERQQRLQQIQAQQQQQQAEERERQARLNEQVELERMIFERQRKFSTSSDGSRISIPHPSSLIGSSPPNNCLLQRGFTGLGLPLEQAQIASLLAASAQQAQTSAQSLQQHLQNQPAALQQQFASPLRPIVTPSSSGISVPPSASSTPSSITLQPQNQAGQAKPLSRDDDEIQVVDSTTADSPSQSGFCASKGCRKRTQGSDRPAKPKVDHSRNILYKTTMQEHQRHLMSKGLVLNTHQSMVMRLRYIAEHVIRALNEFGWAVVDNFLGSEQCKFTYKEIERLYDRGLFTAGQVADGKSRDGDHIRDIRSDYIYWFDGSDRRAEDAATVRLLVSMIDSVILHFNKRIPPYTIAGRSRAMIAIYPGNGTRYVKHVDNPMKDGRCITTIYYCNENWSVERDGGALRLYPETSDVPMDVDPKADRLVFFWSDRRNPHEVMPVYRHRFAITIWYMDKEERREALERMQHSDTEPGRARIESGEVEVEKKRTPPVDTLGPTRKPLAQSNAHQARPTRIDDVADSGMEDNVSILSGSAHPPRHAIVPRPPRVSSQAGSVAQDRIAEERGSVASEEGNELPAAHDVNPEYVI